MLQIKIINDPLEGKILSLFISHPKTTKSKEIGNLEKPLKKSNTYNINLLNKLLIFYDYILQVQ